MTVSQTSTDVAVTSVAPQSLLDSVRAIAEPFNYYAGTTAQLPRIPVNVILFHRDSPEYLGPARALHNRFVLIVNCAAAGNVIVDDRSLRLRPGQAILVFPHQFHHYLDIEQTPTLWMFVTFEHPEPVSLDAFRGTIVTVPARAWSALANLAQAWNERGAPEGSYLADTRVVLHCALALTELLSAVSPSPRPARRGQSQIDTIHRFVVSRLNESFEIDSVARYVRLSPSRLRAVYRAATGISLGRYVSQMRLNRASGLLLNSIMSVKQIAVACGYDSLFSFSRAFKRAMALSPREYRRQHVVAPREGGSG